MLYRRSPAGLAGLCALLAMAAPFLRASDGDPTPKEILRRALRNDARNRELERTYTYVQRDEERTLDAKGAVTHRESTTWDVTPLQHGMYRRLVQRDDKPLSPKEEREQETARKKREAARREADEKRAAETPEERQKREAAEKRSHEREDRDMDQIAEGFDLRIVAEEEVDGVPVWVIEGSPKPGFKFTTSRFASIAGKMKGRIWVSKTDYQPVRIDAETTDTISLGVVLARVYKGTRFRVEFTRVNGEVWLAKRMSYRVTGRILVKGLRQEGESTYSGYKKFSADSRLVSF